MSMRSRSGGLSRRLIKIFLALVAIPVMVTVALLGRVGREQILWSTETMRSIHASSLDSASDEFQQLGKDAAHRSSQQSAQISDSAVGSMVQKLQATQSGMLRTTARDLASLTKASLAEAVERSVETNRKAVGRVTRQTSALLEKSASEMRSHSLNQLESAMLDMIGLRLEERAARIATRVSDHVSDHQNFLSLTAQMPEMNHGTPAGQKAVLDALVRRFPMFTNVALVDSSGNETAMSSSDSLVTESDHRNRADEEYFKVAMAGQTFLQLARNTSPSQSSLQLAVPVDVYRGKTVGVLSARLSLDDLFDSIRSTRIGEKGCVYVEDSTGKALIVPTAGGTDLVSREVEVESLGWKIVVVQPRSEAVLPITKLQTAIDSNTQSTVRLMRNHMSAASQEAARELSARTNQIREDASNRARSHVESVFSRLRSDATTQSRAELARMRSAFQLEAGKIQKQIDERMTAAARTARSGMALRVGPLEREAIRGANRSLTLWSILMLIFFCVAGGLVALLVAGRIVRPVEKLAEGTRAIAAGDLNRRIDETDQDEIGDLAAAFNSMADSLQRSHAELNSAEAQLVQSAKLASLGTLSAGVAHELNQPVAIVRGISQQLSDEPDIPNYVKEDLALIEKQTGRMVKIIKHLRTFCRMGANEYTEVDINQTVQDCFILIGAQLAAHNIQVELELCPDSLVVMADGNEIEQVLLNLITNARDALEDREDSLISIRTWLEDNEVVVQLRDNGTGVPEAVLSRIFDPFFTTKEPGKGTGLGLSISHSIITKHKGTIAVENSHGAVFTITLPRHMTAINSGHPMEQAA